MTRETACPMWGKGNPATIQQESINASTGERVITEISLIQSPRAGGTYRISQLYDSISPRLQLLSNEAKARLTTWLVEQRRRGIGEPVITRDILVHFEQTDRGDSLSMSKRGDNLLRFLVNKTESAGDVLVVRSPYPEALAWSESIDWPELRFLLTYLSNRGFIENFDHSQFSQGVFQATVTVAGHVFLEETAANPDRRQAFVAMWFSEEMDDAYLEGIRPAIEEAGYEPLRIDLKPDVKKIDDEIFSEIRRSRFLVADMTQGDDGARGGVYFEAGLAEGLGIPVFYACHKHRMNNLAFDIRQFYHIEWETPEELRKALATRIRARVGEGPLRGVNDHVQGQNRP